MLECSPHTYIHKHTHTHHVGLGCGRLNCAITASGDDVINFRPGQLQRLNQFALFTQIRLKETNAYRLGCGQQAGPDRPGVIQRHPVDYRKGRAISYRVSGVDQVHDNHIRFGASLTVSKPLRLVLLDAFR